MITALYLFVAQALLGAFDTLYFHEWRARLPGGMPGTKPELVIHGVRDLIYAALFGVLPFFRCNGLFDFALIALLLTEIVLTLRDFVVEDTVRKPMGGVFPGERVMHAIMGIIYGAALAHLVPELLLSATRPTALVPWDAPLVLRLALPPMAFGVFLAGIRDLSAAYGPTWCRYPWVKA